MTRCRPDSELPRPLAFRAGFTLLEVLLATAIGALLMSGLYVAMEIHVRHAQAGRDVVEQSQMVRALLARMDSDIRLSLAPTLPSRSGSSGAQAAGGATATGGTAAAGGTTATPTTGTTPATTTSTTTDASAQSTGTAVLVNLGVQGDTGLLVLSVSRVVRDLVPTDEARPVVADLRRITYWLGGNGELGLCREELKPVTADDANAPLPPDVPDEASHVIAEEVRSLQFRYFDGTAWQETWDGTAPGADGMTPQGPPMAIEITIGVLPPGQAAPMPGTMSVGGQAVLKSYVHVVTIPTANGLPSATTTTTAGTTN